MGSPQLDWHNLLPCYSCCRKIWIPEQAAFGKHCTGVVAQIPLYISLLVLFCRYALYPLWRRRPAWLQSFAAESDELAPDVGRTTGSRGPLLAGVPAHNGGTATTTNTTTTTTTNGHDRSHVAGGGGGGDGSDDYHDEDEDDDSIGGDDDIALGRLRRKRTWSRLLLALFNLSVAGVVAGALEASLLGGQYVHLMPVVPCLVSAIILAVERPQTAPGAVFLIHAGLLLTQFAVLLGAPHIMQSWGSLLAFVATTVVPLASIAIVLVMPLRDPRAQGTEEVALKGQEPTSRLRSPEDNFTAWDWMTISWMGKLIGIGYDRQVHPEDVWILPYEFQHRRLHLLFRQIKGSVIGRVLRANAPDLIIMSTLGIFEAAAALVQVVLLKQLLGALEGREGDENGPVGDGDGDDMQGVRNVRVAMAYASIALFVRLAAAQSAVFSLWFSRRCYERSRGEMITMIYEKTIRRKAFTFPGANQKKEDDEDGDRHVQGQGANREGTSSPKLSPDEAHKDAPASMGKILNLMRNDVYEVAQRFWEFPTLFTKPLNFLLSLALIWDLLGPSALIGILVIVATQLVNALLIRGLVRIERARRAISDLKLQVTSQFVETIRHLRWYDWQERWLSEILTTRQKELRYRVWSNLLQKALNVLNSLAALALPMASFYAYTVISGRPLSVDIAFPALNLFTMLNTSLTELPFLVMVLVNASVAMGRIESFMAEPDKEDGGHDGQNDTNGPPGDLKLKISGASFSWPGTSGRRHVLRNVNMECGPGLTVVCGKVGAGKSALLQAILGELDQQPGGEREIPDEMAGYCAQTPWLQSMSIRENILFSEPYNATRYRRTLEACALLPDLQEFEGGDLSMVGENGVGLSGGQKARVALARAIYSRARLLLLDDPIAALDHHTAESVVRKLFSPGGLCDGRLVVLVTHRADLVRPFASQIYEVFTDRPASLEKHRPEELDTDAEFHRRVAAEAAQQALEEGDDSADHGNAAAAIPDKFIQEEHRAHGGVMASVYWRYVKAGKLWLWILLIAVFVMHRASNLLYFYFLKVWGEAYKQHGTSDAHRRMAGSLYLHDQTAFLPMPEKAHFMQLRGGTSHHGVSDNASSQSGSDGWINIDFGLPPPQDNVHPWLFWFFILSAVQLIAQLLSDLTLVAIVYAAGKKLFEDVMRRVAAATFRFYDVTPVGRLMNRLTSDISTIDGSIAGQLHQVAFHTIAWLSAVAVIATTTPYFLALAVAMTGVFVYIFQRFLPLSQSLRRLEMVSLSPLMSNFGTLLEGLTTVRAFRAQPHFEHRIIVTTDAFQQMDHFYWSLQSWLTYRFDALSALSTFALTFTALSSGLSSGAVAFVLAAAATFVDTTHVLCRKYGELQMMFVSVERVIELLDLETEPEVGSAGSSGPPNPLTTPPPSWPSTSDDIVFDKVTLRYAPDLEPSLRDASFRIPAGSTVAVTGRTGSGKSTLALALLGTILPDQNPRYSDEEGLVDIDQTSSEDHLLREGNGGQEGTNGHHDSSAQGTTHGSIWIGDVDIARVDKHALRRRVSFVAQDPVLFPGTLRENLDPLREYTDIECAQVLARVLGPSGSATTTAAAAITGAEETENDCDDSGLLPPLTQVASPLAPKKLRLGTRVDGGGKNLSQGQRQLVGIARAVLRRSPLVILDEATASIDVETALRIQAVLRQELRGSTVVTIAHRAEAVRDADFALELERGRVVRAERIGGGAA